jgi:Arc-like DNA binding domain
VTEEQPKRKPGRPSKGKRGNFTFRVTEKLREQLISGAEASGLSVSEEIERRLDQSFNDAAIRDLLGGSHTNALILTIAAAIQMVEIKSGKKWIEDHDTNLAMRAAVDGVMELLNTPPENAQHASDSKFGALLNFLEPHQSGTRAAADAVTTTRKAQRRHDHPDVTKEPKS